MAEKVRIPTNEPGLIDVRRDPGEELDLKTPEKRWQAVYKLMSQPPAKVSAGRPNQTNGAKA